MKKLAFLLALVAGTAAAQVDDLTFTLTAAGTNQANKSYITRGSVEGVLITIPAAKTAAVTVVTASGFTVYSKSGLTAATDGFVPLQYPFYGSDGSALYAGTNAVVGKISIAESVTATVIPAANTATNSSTYTVKLIVGK